VRVDLLLEIGTEEIPDWMIRRGLAQLTELVEGVFHENRLFFRGTSCDATPRRLVVRATEVEDHREDKFEFVKGPPVSAGDRAAQGFLSKQGGTISDLCVDAEGKYYQYRKRTPGRPTLDILSESLPAIVPGIHWPKTMYWTAPEVLLGAAPPVGFSVGPVMDQATLESIKRSKPRGEEVYVRETGEGARRWAFKSPRFIRPIRWIVALLGDEVIRFEIAGVKSGNVTRGHRQLGSSSIPISIANYESELRRNFVILSSHERRHKIEKEAAALGARVDADLLETLTFITEYPTAIRGEFDPKFLELPAEVLTTVMRHHQKYFSVESAPNLLAPNFVAVMNTPGDPDGLVKHGNERVLKARFNDARFFWDVDQVKKLADRVEDLKKVTFHVKLGSYFEKTQRVVELVKELGGNFHAQRAALLCKADLTTEMVKEFTELQGIVGGLYASAQGEPEPVGRAIYEHYQPVSMEDSIAETHEGQIVSLADKLDTLRECFRIGIVPTGSKDPFALRRAAQGVVKILVEGAFRYPLGKLASAPGLAEFIVDRVRYYFRDLRGFKYDEVNAVLAVGTPLVTLDLPDAEARLKALSSVRLSPNFEPLAASFKRIRNILKQADFKTEFSMDPSLLEDGPERDLYSEFQRVTLLILNTNDHEAALNAIASIRPTVDRFFDKVLVNVPDAKLRANRLTFLDLFLTNFSTIADFSEIVTSGEQK
jgi:glycyl-tRNA synthetase beta chain